MPSKQPIEHAGKQYKSLRELASVHELDFGTFHARLKKGLTIDEALVPADRSIRFGVLVRGVQYASQKEACTVLGVSMNTVQSRMKILNLPFEEALLWEKQGETIGEKCARHGVLRWTYWARIRRGWTEEQALGVAPPPPRHDVAEPSVVRLKFQYGITIEEYEALIAKNNGLCWICNEEPNPPCIDHDHKTGRVRGILCKACNTAIGRMKDDPSRLRAAAVYLEAS